MSRSIPSVCALALVACATVGCSAETIIAVTDGTHSPIHDGADSAPQKPASTGYHIVNNRVTDATGAQFHVRGITWFGLETNSYAPHGLWSRSLSSTDPTNPGVLMQIKMLGFNTIRLPWSSELLRSNDTPNVDSGANLDLKNLNGLGIMDKVIQGAGDLGLKIILTRHGTAAGTQGPLWYDPADSNYSEARWIDDWKQLATRYRDYPALLGCDLQSDLRSPATWGDGNMQTDFRLAAERAGNEILRVNPNVLILVEGVETVDGHTYWRGGNLRGVKNNPVRLDAPDRLVYATQDFPYTASDGPPGGVTWFDDPSFPANLTEVWRENWGYLIGNTPVLLGAFGTRDTDSKDQHWLSTVVPYIASHDLDFAYFALNPDSGDTGGVLGDDWQTPRPDLVTALAPILTQ